MMKRLTFALLLGTSAAFGQGRTTEDIMTRLQTAEAENPAMQPVWDTIERMVQDGQRSMLRDIWMREISGIGGGDSVALDAIEAHLQAELAENRASALAELLVHDLNGDGEITLEEQNRAEADGQLRPHVLRRVDTNEDGVITLPEMLADAERRVGPAEYDFAAALLHFDLDGNGSVDATEVADVLAALTETYLPHAAAAGCGAPPPEPGEQLIVLGAYEGAALSTVHLGDPNEETQVAEIVIEPGTAPLYLFVNAYEQIIWQITGATDRVSRMVVQDRGLSGVTGLAADRVQFVADCLDDGWNIEGATGTLAYRDAERVFGRGPDGLMGRYTVGALALPSGRDSVNQGDGNGRDVLILDGLRYELTPEGPRLLDTPESLAPNGDVPGVAQTRDSLNRFHPFGLRAVDPAEVVTSGQPAEYDVLPAEAGLLQLLVSGQMQYTPDGRYRIAEPIARFPAGLYGAHGVRFIIAEGVPLPEGSPGHSSVIDAATGECLTHSCR